jgi:excinuclease ABC subunit C
MSSPTPRPTAPSAVEPSADEPSADEPSADEPVEPSADEPSQAAWPLEGVEQESGSEADLRLARVLAKLGELPTRPGCYLFHDRAGKVVYVGKAKSLRSRVRSYFQDGGSDARFFIPILRRIVGDLETVVTGTEKEAAVLENELIKKHKPRFNVKLRDDKDFLCLRVDLRQRWPRVEPVRRPSPDGARYFGPFHSATSARRTLHLVNKHWQLRTCSDAELASRRRPCLQFQIKRCPAPCVYDVDPGHYQQQVESVSLFLEGRHDELSSDLEQRMRDAAGRMEFELAAIYRDQLRAVSSAREEQRVVAIKDVDQDVLGLHREGSLVELVLMQVRKGRMVDSLSFSLRGSSCPTTSCSRLRRRVLRRRRQRVRARRGGAARAAEGAAGAEWRWRVCAPRPGGGAPR